MNEAIVDAHHHLWATTEYSQFTPYLAGELLADVGSVPGVKATVYLECQSQYAKAGPAHLRCVGETVFVDQLTRQSESAPELCAGIVPFADFRLGEGVAEVLEAHLQASSRVRGIRQCTNWDADPALRYEVLNNHAGMMSEAQFRRGFARLREYSLSFDAWVYHPQLTDLLNLAQAFPDIPIVLDHLGGPIGIRAYAGRSEEVYDQWKSSIEDLSRCENVFMKLGGLNMPLSGIHWSAGRESLTAEEICEKTRRYYTHAIDSFSPARCMFESNFPVDKHTCTYGALWQAFDLLTRQYSKSERAAMFGGTAVAFYGLQGISAAEC